MRGRFQHSLWRSCAIGDLRGRVPSYGVRASRVNSSVYGRCCQR